MREITIIAMLVLGLAIGYWAGLHFSGGVLAEFNMASAAEGVSTRLFVLKKLHEGKTNEAMKLLESELDNRIVATAGLLEGVSEKSRADSLLTLKRAAAYRKQWPWTNDLPQLDQLVIEALSKSAK